MVRVPERIGSSELLDAEYVALGKIVVYWSQLEYEIENLYCVLIGLTEEQSQLVVPNLGTSVIIDSVKRVLGARYPDDSSRISGMIRAIKTAKEERDVLLHSPWWIDLRRTADGKVRWAPFPALKPSRRGSARESKPYSKERLEASAKQISDARKGFIDFLHEKKLLRQVLPLSMLSDESYGET